MRKRLSHLAAAVAATLLFGAVAGPLSAAAATPEVYAVPAVVSSEENASRSSQRSVLNKTSLKLVIEYDQTNPVSQLYLTSAAPGDRVYQWYSSNPNVATVDNNGVVRAVNTGSAVIYASTYTGTLQCNVTVSSDIGKVAMSQTQMNLEGIGGQGRLGASVKAANAENIPITWTSSNPAAATVSADGVVTAVGNGQATITATAANGRSATCTVYTGTRVAEVKAERERIEKETEQMAWLILGGTVVLIGVLAMAASAN